jgi:hypothetical protein
MSGYEADKIIFSGGIMNPLRRILFIFAISFVCLPTWGDGVPLQNLGESDFKKVVGDLSANFLHTSVSGAGTLGDIFGFEVGLVGGITNTPHMEKLAHAVDPNADADTVYHGELLGVVTVPFAITGEVGLIPKVGKDDFRFNAMSLALKWTPTKLFFEDFPVDLAAKVYTTKANLDFKDEIVSGAGDTTFTYKNSLMGVTALVSKNFAILEPYFGLGWVKATGDLTATGPQSGSVFLPSYTSSTSVSEDTSSTLWMVGTEVKLLILKLGVEYTHVFDTSRYSAKLSFYF